MAADTLFLNYSRFFTFHDLISIRYFGRNQCSN